MSPGSRGPRLTLAALGRVVAWVALAAALARPRAPGERVGPEHLAFAGLGCLMVWYALAAARAVRRAETTPGRLFALAVLSLAAAVLLAVVVARGGLGVIPALRFLVLLLGAVPIFLAAGLIAWAIEFVQAWRAHLRGRPKPVFPPPSPPEGGEGEDPA